jgi:hypothetical protein
MNPITTSSQTNEQTTTTQPQRENISTYTQPEPSPLARPQVPAVIAICKHWGRSTEHTCGQWNCYLEWGC